MTQAGNQDKCIRGRKAFYLTLGQFRSCRVFVAPEEARNTGYGLDADPRQTDFWSQRYSRRRFTRSTISSHWLIAVIQAYGWKRSDIQLCAQVLRGGAIDRLGCNPPLDCGPFWQKRPAGLTRWPSVRRSNEACSEGYLVTGQAMCVLAVVSQSWTKLRRRGHSPRQLRRESAPITNKC
jgi:hypothetical protein